MIKPVYEHDCEACKWLGPFEFEGQHYELYYHDEPKTVIARFGPDGDYVSGLSFIDVDPVITEAAIRAVSEGHLKYEDVAGCGQTVGELLSRVGRGPILQEK